MKSEHASTKDIHTEKILILDLGHEQTQLIARSIRASQVYCEIHGPHMTGEQIREFAPKGIIITSGNEQITGSSEVSETVFTLGVPVLAIGDGMRVLVSQTGGKAKQAKQPEARSVRVRARGHSPLLVDIQDAENAQGHGLLDVMLCKRFYEFELPEGFYEAANNEQLASVAIANNERQLYGIQFHPEIAQTPQGHKILARFVLDICQCSRLWQNESIIEDLIAKIRTKVGSDQVLLGLSGGVDSSVAAALLHRAIGDQLHCVFVDHGLLRYKEGEAVMETFAKNMGVNVKRVDAEDIFLGRLKGVDEPEKKRKIIGNTFIEIFDENASQIDNVKWLAQGTIYPDVIESGGEGSSQTAVIKSHHNVGGLPEEMKLGLVEPLRELFKDEVRELGIALGLPESMVMRHPFPGPGLGVRIVGEVKKEYADVLRLADNIFIEELRKAGWYNKVSQAFAVYLPVSSVGVVHGQRRYAHVIALRAVETVDFMTARWARLPYELIEKAVDRIVHEVEGVSRVVYDVTGKPPGTIEWE